MSEELGLVGGENARPWSVRGCCATKGEGLHDGLDWSVMVVSFQFLFWPDLIVGSYPLFRLLERGDLFFFLFSFFFLVITLHALLVNTLFLSLIIIYILRLADNFVKHPVAAITRDPSNATLYIHTINKHGRLGVLCDE